MSRVHLKKDKKGHVNCERCHRFIEVTDQDSPGGTQIQVKCKCGHVFYVQVEKRQNYRKRVKLIGTFKRIYPDDTEMGRIIIEDISHTGLGFKTVTRHNLNMDDVVEVEFILDDARASRIVEDGVVRVIKDRFVGIEFEQLSEHNKKALGFYLIQYGIVSTREREQKAVKSEIAKDYAGQVLLVNPFCTSASIPPVVLKGNVELLGTSTVLKILSAKKKTGILHFTFEKQKRALCLKDGKTIAASGNQRLKMGEILLNKGLISPESLQEAVARAKESGKMLGKVLLELGYAKQKTLRNLIRYQIQETERELSLWRGGEFEFRECQVQFSERGIEALAPVKMTPPAQPSPAAKSKREFSRVAVSWPVSIMTSQGTIDGEVKDISLSGALLVCEEFPNPEEELRLSIEIPEEIYSILLSAKIVRLDTHVSEGGLLSYALGVHFVEISEYDSEFLSRKYLH